MTATERPLSPTLRDTCSPLSGALDEDDMLDAIGAVASAGSGTWSAILAGRGED